MHDEASSDDSLTFAHHHDRPHRAAMAGNTYGFPPIFPLPVIPGWNQDPWAFPRASHPTVTHDARRGGNRPCALAWVLPVRHQPNLHIRIPTQLKRPRVARSRCIPFGVRSPACSASVQEFFRSAPESNPSRYIRARRRESACAKRPATNENMSSNLARHRATRSSTATTSSASSTTPPSSPRPERTQRHDTPRRSHIATVVLAHRMPHWGVWPGRSQCHVA